jgi:chemotaxis signal transduction protein
MWTVAPTPPPTHPPNEAAHPDDVALTAVLLSTTRGRFAVPVEQVRGVVRAVGLVPLPGAPPVVAGVVSVRGAIVTVLALDVLLGDARAERVQWVVLLETMGQTIGVGVHAVHDVTSAVDDAVPPLDLVTRCASFLLSPEGIER